MEYTLDQILSLSNEELFSWKGSLVKITKSNGNRIIGRINKFGLAANPPYLVCSIILSDNQNIHLNAIQKLKFL